MAQEQLSGAYLVIQHDPLAGKRVELWKDCTTIGRSRDRDIFLEDLTVHRKQASIVRTSDGYILRDDHGSGDSLVNGQPVTEYLLNNGDQLCFGNTYMTFYASEGTRPIQLPSSRGRERYIGKTPDTPSQVIARLDFSNAPPGSPVRRIELLSQMTIGRSRECNIFLEDLTVSRLHATIRELPGGNYEISDNHSATGTFVNGQLTTHRLLHEGDVIQIGSSRLVFRLTRA
jgi:pSer/pThr/pTyr-binding forkhead associated (FHA) protein